MGGFFITFEGGEGAGKSTQARCLAEALTGRGYCVCLTREPGGTEGAEALRQLVLFGKTGFSWRAEVMVLLAARCDHIDKVIRPALNEGKIVICDRFHDSTLAYQGYGPGAAEPQRLDFIQTLRKLMALEPDLTFWLDVPPEEGLVRVAERGGRTDRYEEQKKAFHHRVRDGFARICQRQEQDEGRKRICRLDARLAQEEVGEIILQIVTEHLGHRQAAPE